MQIFHDKFHYFSYKLSDYIISYLNAICIYEYCSKMNQNSILSTDQMHKSPYKYYDFFNCSRSQFKVHTHKFT